MHSEITLSTYAFRREKAVTLGSVPYCKRSGEGVRPTPPILKESELQHPLQRYEDTLRTEDSKTSYKDHEGFLSSEPHELGEKFYKHPMVSFHSEPEVETETLFPSESTMGKKSKDGTIDDRVGSSYGKTVSQGQEYLSSKPQADYSTPYNVDKADLGEQLRQGEATSVGVAHQSVQVPSPEDVQAGMEYLAEGLELYVDALVDYAEVYGDYLLDQTQTALTEKGK